MSEKKRIKKEWIIVILLWLSVGITIWLSITIPIAITEKLANWPTDLAKSSQLENRFSADSARSTITYSFKFDMPYIDRDEILKLSSDASFITAVNNIFDNKHWWLWYLIPILWITLVFLFEVYHRFTKKGFDKSFEKAFDYRVVLVLFAFTCLFTFVLFQGGMLSTSTHASNFWEARIEFFLTWGVFLAIVGAFYAVFAKRRADASFDKGEEIYQAITSFFTNYDEIMNEENKRSILNLIEKSKKSLTFCLGSPLIGYFRDEKMGNRFHAKLLEKLNDIGNPNFKVKFLCWSDTYCKEYYANHDGTDFEEKRNTLIRAIQKLGSERGRVHHPKADRESVFRFVIADEKEAIFWLLEDPSPDAAKQEKKAGRLKGGGFTSDREPMIEILNNLFDKTPTISRPVPVVATSAPAAPPATGETK